MSEAGELFGLGDTIAKLMQSPEIAEIMQSISAVKPQNEQFSTNDENSDFEETTDGNMSFSANAENPQAPPSLDKINLSPELMAKLPSMISAISGLGIDPTQLLGGLGGKEKSKESESNQKMLTGDKRRRALLSSIRPYLSPKRQGIIDGMLQLESLTNLLGPAMNTAKSRKGDNYVL